MSSFNFFEVGGCVRDALLGVQSKDIDFAVEAPSFQAMKEFFTAQGFQIFLETPEHQTLRAKFPKGHPNEGMVADFVLCRKESGYSDGRHPDEVQPGSIFDDLARRDFTVNAIARNLATGELLDPHNGQQDLADRVLRCVGSAKKQIAEDPLRALRAVRLSLTKGLRLHEDVVAALHDPELPGRLASVSTDRKREELAKAFKANTLAAFRLIASLPPALQEAIFADSALWLKPTTEQ